ncbi:aminoacyl-tRNA hydrolase KNAG_0E01150 [Huiozyma naganishii CBS 8797]|uniref:peptidyl-tRNA hydrolase n=1 Tax=Huiozyma naganishii (strain ATCC MYA-139 / BCRC 22969 / CBS 8797 / KCTC 17520 / NBRC 10181 / NCYC 3082 / Yp74L-3) TaxID=1071383 RepID=J7RYW6_HUIN7|nr:hypothetical protein KNAG_0E01150 [Kazachstania naganishii CBS 8797]CCK70382.1 hypothetical protein KNAG_0E01150 [Kazachstania naganishii CBS 8797]
MVIGRVSIRSIYTCVSGLGNMEPQYAGTRHNVGLKIVQMLGDQLSAGAKPFVRSRAAPKVEYLSIPSLSLVLLLSNGGYMNESGKTLQSVWRKLNRRLGGQKVRHIVVHDELALSLGKLQLREPGRSVRGHNGLKDIERCCGTNFYRLAIGIGRPESRDPADVADYVLGRLSPEENSKLKELVLPRVWPLISKQ